MGYFDGLKPTTATPAATHQLRAVPDDGTANNYALAALKGETNEVLAATEGTRNDRLNKAWFNMARHIGAGSIDPRIVRDTLADAARAIGLPQHEIDLVLRDDDTSALRAGTAIPRIPTAPDTPAATITEVTPDQLLGASPQTTETAPAQVEPLIVPIIDWHELYAHDDDDEWIIHPILPARRMVALYSAPKVGKSLLMLEIAVGIAQGTETLAYKPDRPRRVLYVDFENDPRGDVRTRLRAMGKGPDDLDNLCYLSYPTLAKFDTPTGAADLLRHVHHYDCEVVVIDTVSRSVAGEENDNDTWLAFYRNTGLALKQAQVACIRLDHTGKDHDRGMRGGSAKYGDVDAVWRLTTVSDDVLQLECTDHRLPISDKQLTLTRRTDPLRHEVAVNPWLTAKGARIDQIISILDRLDIAPEAGVRPCGDALRSAGYRFNNDTIRAAVRHRKNTLNLPPEFDDD